MRLDEAIWPNKYMLTVLGLWPSMRFDTGPTRRIFTYFQTVCGIFAVICLLAPHLMTVITNWGNVKILGDYGGLTVIFFLLTLKMMYYALHQTSLESMYQHVKDLWDIGKNSREREQYEKLAKIAKLVIVVSFLAGITDFFSFEAAAFINLVKNHREVNESLRHRPLPLDLSYGFNTQLTPMYEIMFIWQTVCMLAGICASVGCDCTLLFFILHLSGQFRLIGFRFRKIGRNIGERNDHELQSEIQECITQHQHIIRVTTELDQLQSPLFFCQIVTSGMQICLSGYSVIEGDGSGLEFVKFLIFFICLLIQLVVWCAPAELLIQESTAIADIIYYDIPWFRLTPRQQRDLRFVMMRAQKGCHLSAIYQVMSIRKLTDVFNAAGSYMALLRSMKK